MVQIKYRTERAFHYTGIPVLEMRYSARNLYKGFSTPSCLSYLMLILLNG